MEFTNEQIEDIFNSTYKKSKICELLNINPNGKNAAYVDNQILIYSSRIGLTTRKDISSKNIHKRYWDNKRKEYELNPKYCLNCGKKIPFENRFNKCCNASCAATISNKIKGKRSEETKRKISQTLHNRYGSSNVVIKKPKNKKTENKKPNNKKTENKSLENKKIYKLISELVNEGKILNENNYSFEDKRINENTLKEKYCLICGKKYYALINKFGNLSFTKTCSDNCRKQLQIQRGKETAKRVMAEGRFVGWQTRNIKSYAEIFWHKVLQNNGIEYIAEYFLDKKYFLDFYIVKNGIEIDLEIDGKQHKYKDRIEHDKIRDEYIKSKGIVVYRIDWNEINSEMGSLMMKEKIDNFLDFYNNII